MSKICGNCGAELAEGASFCPYCEQPLEEKRPVKVPRPRRRWAAAAAVLVLAAAALAFLLRQTPAPQIYEGGAEVVDPAEGGVCHVLLTFQSGDQVQRDAQPEASSTLPDGTQFYFPSQLYVYRENTEEDVTGAFLELVERAEVTAEPEDGAQAMTATEPAYDESFPYAAMASHIGYSAACGTNQILWTLTMKNGDTIRLRQTIHASLQPTVDYYPEDAPMDTLKQLQDLVDAISREVDPGTAVNLYLPPVTYEGGLSLSDRTCTLYGSSDGERRTTFTGTVSVGTDTPQFTEIYGVCFQGSGGTGLLARGSVQLYDCVFTGWDTGALAADGAWVAAEDCVFSDNAVGLQFDTGHSSMSAPVFPNNQFLRNGTGILLARVPGTELLSFPGCEFSDNGTDIDNPDQHPLDAFAGTVSP